MTDRPTCRTCPYWASIDDRDGQCRRHSPRAVAIGEPANLGEQANPFVAAWLETLDTQWCGDHPSFPEWLAGREKQTPINQALSDTDDLNRLLAAGELDSPLAEEIRARLDAIWPYLTEAERATVTKATVGRVYRLGYDSPVKEYGT